MEKTAFTFDHEKLVAYQRSIQFVAWATDLLESVPAKLSVSDQLDRASTSVPLNIAEGNGKFTRPDRLGKNRCHIGLGSKSKSKSKIMWGDIGLT
jgi:four helix bundle protein